jgi:hypothetical protein
MVSKEKTEEKVEEQSYQERNKNILKIWKKGNAKWGGGEFIRWLNSCFVREKERINKGAYL